MVSVGWWRARRQQRRVSKPSSSTRASFSCLRRATLPCRALASRPHPPSQAPPLSARGADIYSGGKRSRSFERSRRGSAARAALRPPPAPVPALRDGERRYRARECNDVWLETHPASSSRTPPRVAGEAQRAGPRETIDLAAAAAAPSPPWLRTIPAKAPQRPLAPP